MAEAMLCDQLCLTDDNQCESIVVFVEQMKDNEKMKELYEAWENICSDLHKDIMYVRWKLDSWFQECYNASKDVQKLSNDVSHEMAQERKEKLFEKFSNEIEDVACKEKDTFINKLKIQTARDEIMKNYRNNPEEWVDKAVECVERESQLMANFKQVKLEEEKAEANQKIEKELFHAKVLEKDISKCMEKMRNEVTNWNQHFSKKEESEQNLNNLVQCLETTCVQKKNEVMEVRQLKNTISECDSQMNRALEQITLNHQEIIKKFGELQTLLTELVTGLVEGVCVWKEEFKFQYAELAASPNLKKIAPWCAQAGRLIYDLINVNLTSWNNILTNIECDNKEKENFRQNFCDLLTYFLQCTFVVTEQESFIIKVDKKHLPKFVVRILAAENFPERTEIITARFAFEDDINTCCRGNTLDLIAMQEKVQERGITLQSHNFKFENAKKKDKCEACFQTLHFKGKFSRQGIQTGKQVHEEKSRIVFTTNIHGQDYWTMSLPLVVTTGANQGCLSQASVMWQCFSTDVYCVPITECAALPWCQVADMLQAKMQKLCPTRKLTAENINHLKRRLFGRGDISDEELVTLKKFCFDKLDKTDSTDENSQLTFSFWKWFIGIYNLLDKYLLSFWKDGLIVGFISKDEAKEKLKRCKSGRSGTFLLRFSDQNITDSQGVKSVFGHLTACVLIIKEELDGRKKKKLYDMDVAGHKKLKEKNLANILKETQEDKLGKFYQYLYPGDKTRDEIFDSYCDKDAVVPGYTGTRDAFVVNLEQQLAALEITCGKHMRSPSIDSGIDPSSPSSTVQSLNGSSAPAAKVKKQRVSVNHPTIAKMLQQGNSSQIEDNSEYSSQMEVRSDLSSSPQYNVFAVPSPANSGLSPGYLGSSPAPSTMSPAYAPTPSPANSTQNLSQDVHSLSLPADFSGFQHPDMSGDESPKCLSLPTVIEDAVPARRRVTKQNMVPISNDIAYPSAGSCTADQGNGDGATHMIIEDESGQMCISFETGSPEVIVQQLSGHSSLESNSSSLSAVSGGQQCIEITPMHSEEFYNKQMANNGLKSKEPVTSTVPDQQDVLNLQPCNPELTQILSWVSTLQPNELKVLQNNLDQMMASVLTIGTAQMSNALDQSSICPVVTTSATPVLTSSGSMTDAFNFSQREIAEVQEMNSGTIDTSVFAIIETGSGGMPT